MNKLLLGSCSVLVVGYMVPGPTGTSFVSKTTDPVNQAKLINDAIANAEPKGVVCLRGIYTVADTIRLRGARTLKGPATIKLAAGVTLSSHSPDRKPAVLTLLDSDCSLQSITVEGDRIQPGPEELMYGVLVSGPVNGIRIHDLVVRDVKGNGLMVMDTHDSQISNVLAERCNGDGILLYGRSSFINCSNFSAYNNGIIGFAIEGSPAFRPSNIVVSGLTCYSNGGEHVLLRCAKNVVLQGVCVEGDTNNGAIKFLTCIECTVSNYCLQGSNNATRPNPHGVWLHDELGLGRNSEILLGQGYIQGFHGDAVRLGPGETLRRAAEAMQSAQMGQNK